MSADHCPACGHAWTAHPGIAATCCKLQAAQEENRILRAALKEATERMARLLGEDERRFRGCEILP